MWGDNTGWTFSLEEKLLWIMDLYLVQKLKIMDFLLTNTQIFTSQDI